MITELILCHYLGIQLVIAARSRSMNLRVLPGLDSRLDILEPLFEPIGILERALVGVRVVDER